MDVTLQRKCRLPCCCKCLKRWRTNYFRGNRLARVKKGPWKKNLCTCVCLCVKYEVILCSLSFKQPCVHTPPTHTHTHTHTYELPSLFISLSFSSKSDFSLNSNYISPVIYSSYYPWSHPFFAANYHMNNGKTCDHLSRGKEEIWLRGGRIRTGRFWVTIRSRGRLVFHMISACQIILPQYNLACLTVKPFFTADSLSCRLSARYPILLVLLFAASRADHIASCLR